MRIRKQKPENCPYQEQANKFMEKYDVTMKASLSHHGPYFNDDKDTKRDVYNITLERGGEIHTFTFGQSLDKSGIARKALGGQTIYDVEREKQDAKKRRGPPNSYDVFACLQKNEVGTFHQFCADFGYDTDSIKARDIYFRVQEECEFVNSMFHDCLDELSEIA